jgi:hypothetical protein
VSGESFKTALDASRPLLVRQYDVSEAEFFHLWWLTGIGSLSVPSSGINGP